MKSVRVTILTILLIVFLAQPLLSIEPAYRDVVNKFIKAIKSNDHAAIANLVVYPLHRKVPLPRIDTPDQFLQLIDDVFDRDILKAIANSNPADDDDWFRAQGNIGFSRGILWLDDNGKLLAVNYQTKKEKDERVRLIEAAKHKLHSSLQKFSEPVLEWKTKDYRIRIDRIDESHYRYAVWPAQKESSEKPDMILNNGELHFDGSGGNHFYEFKSDVYLYSCYVFVMGEDSVPEIDLTVYKNGNEILSQPAIEVIMSR